MEEVGLMGAPPQRASWPSRMNFTQTYPPSPQRTRAAVKLRHALSQVKSPQETFIF